jgi:hypothetical protein
MATAWDLLLAKSSLQSGTAWDHLVSAISIGSTIPDPVYVDTKFKIQKKAENVFEASIDMITYGVSFIAINKKIREHWI